MGGREGRGSCTLHGKESWGSSILGSKRRQLLFHGGRGGAVAIFMRGTGRAAALFKEEGRDSCLLYGFALLWIENAYRRPGVCSSTEEIEKSLSMPSSSWIIQIKISFLTVERENKAEIYTSTAWEQKSLGTIDIRHDGYHVDYKVLVRHVVSHSRFASVASTFVSVLYRYCYCYCFVTRKPFKPRRVCGIALVRGIRFRSLFPTGVFWFFVPGGVTGYQVTV